MSGSPNITVTNLTVDGELLDGDGSFGSSGQVLSSDGTDLAWVNAGSLTAGAAALVGVTAVSDNSSHFITFVDTSSGNENIKVDTDLTYNPSTNALTASSFVGNVTGDLTGDVTGDLTGNVTGNVTGNATGLSGSPSITVTNITAVGNVSIAGTLTYEDVTSVDSVGVVTARIGVDVTTGGVDIANGGLNVVGVSTFNDNVILLDNDKLKLGTGGDLEIYHDGSHSYIDDAGTGNLRLRSGTVEITNLAGSKKSATFNSASGQELYYNNNLKFETINTGVSVTGELDLDYGAVETITSTKTSTSEASVDSFAAATYRSVSYDVQITRGTSYHTTTIKILHDGTNTYMTEYGTMNTGTSLASFSSDINSGNVRLLATPSSATSTVFKIVRTLIKV